MKKKSYSLSDLIPSESSFKLKQFGDLEFKLKPCTGGMLLKMSQKLGNVEKLLADPNVVNISKIAIMLMEYESAVKFKKQKIKTIDVITGDEEELDIGGYELLSMTIQGVSEQYKIYGAILISFGYDEEKANDIVKDIESGMNDLVTSKLEKNKSNLVKKKTTKKKMIKKK